MTASRHSDPAAMKELVQLRQQSEQLREAAELAYGLLTLVVSAIFLPFFLRLPTAFKLRLGAAAFLYVSGAIGLEMAAANHVSSSGGEGAAYPFLVAVEENLEMGALLLVVDSLLAYLQRECRGFQLRIDAPEA